MKDSVKERKVSRDDIHLAIRTGLDALAIKDFKDNIPDLVEIVCDDFNVQVPEGEETITTMRGLIEYIKTNGIYPREPSYEF
tara:strand:- start:911 stop:1156 length:246 start_codon:yes stop_codon:yes gene_type:complete